MVKRALLAVGVLALLLILCFVSVSPAVPLQPRATAADISAGREAAEQIKDARGKTTKLHLTGREVEAVGTLMREASGITHAQTLLDEEGLHAAASLPIGLGLWVNGSVSVSGKHTGFPDLKVTLGRVTFPAALSRWGAATVRFILTLKGVKLPTLDTMVQSIAVTPQSVAATLALPKSTGLLEQAVAAAGEQIDNTKVAQVYCQLAPLATQKPEFTALVNRAFANAPADNPQDHNRAALIALAFHVVGNQAYKLAPDALDEIRKCLPKDAKLAVTHAKLASRADLAKHWAFSAALSAKLGQNRAVALGELKELRDSLGGGSGFSFVDLAANRSGLRTARYALAPETALTTARALTTVTEDALLPLSLREGQEGLTEAEFIDRFGALDEVRYSQAANAIDQRLTFPAR